ncbi:cytosolic carboxypeptidase 1 [Lasius niger]|uniref:Cytosolic carboxypeptidase 1 n=1 Tax=Lasius niger TaxID=67767 RepID=A0A0J7KRX3_LASNI|nr:cytosolic carboxypeptidase 1 [Lasius niger]
MAVIQLINLGITQVLVKLLINLQHADTITSEVLTQDILWILGQVAQRDQKFVSKMKLLNSIKVFHALLKQHYNNSKTLLSLLLIIKTLAKNYRVFLCDIDSDILLAELCCNKFIKIGMVYLLMRIFERWERFDGQMRLKICNYALNTLQHLCVINLSSSTNVLLEVAGIMRVFFFVQLPSRSWKEGYQVEQWPTATVPVLYELSRGQSL